MHLLAGLTLHLQCRILIRKYRAFEVLSVTRTTSASTSLKDRSLRGACAERNKRFAEAAEQALPNKQEQIIVYCNRGGRLETGKKGRWRLFAPAEIFSRHTERSTTPRSISTAPARTKSRLLKPGKPRKGALALCLHRADQLCG